MKTKFRADGILSTNRTTGIGHGSDSWHHGIESGKWKMVYRIRAHHGMCFSFFRGKGYSGEFTENMEAMKEKLRDHAEVLLLQETDDVCAHCPNNHDGVCAFAGKVADYDAQVLMRCGILPHTQMSWEAFEKLVYEKILSAGKREEICGGCQWNELCKSLS